MFEPLKVFSIGGKNVELITNHQSLITVQLILRRNTLKFAQLFEKRQF